MPGSPEPVGTDALRALADAIARTVEAFSLKDGSAQNALDIRAAAFELDALRARVTELEASVRSGSSPAAPSPLP